MTGPGPRPVTARGASIQARAWGYTYPGRARPALADVSLSIGPGELVVLMGPSGSGKSTLLAALAGTLPEGGRAGRLEVRAAGVAWDDRGEAAAQPDRAGAPPAGVGLVQQEPEANIVMERVGDDVAFPLENAAAPAARIWPRVGAVLAAVGLDVALQRSTAELSGGQQQLLGVAAAAVAGPELLLLDEPTANLDSRAATQVRAAVEWVRRATGCTVVVVEHRVEEWLHRADRVLLVESGSVADLAPDELSGHLAARPDLAARVWVDHRNLPDRAPRRAPGDVVLRGRGLRVGGRLRATDLEARAGEVVALTGPPGSGKSTLLAVLAGLFHPSSGSVEVRPGGQGPARGNPWDWPAVDVATTFGVVFQNPEHQFLAGRVDDELRHGLAASGLDEPQVAGRISAMLERLHLADLAAVNPFTLSGGQQRRLSVGTALVRDPGILLLDEPTFGQDPATWSEVVDIVAAHRDAGGAVVLATHDPHLVTALGARELRMGAGPAGPGGAEDVPDRGGPANSTGALGAAATPPGGDGAEAGGVVGAGGGSEAGDRGVVDAGDVAEAMGPRLGAPAPTQAPTPGRGLRALDPLALLGAASLVSGAALLSGSVAANLGLALLALLAAVLGGLSVRRVALLALPAVVAGASVAFSNALLSGAGLTSAQAWSAAALPASRVLAVALPGLVAAVAIDPTALADSLVVRLRVPARAAYSVLAGLRLLPLLAEEWSTLARASRARGLGGRGLRARAGQFASMTMRLLVAALRRGGRLAVALDARGLRSGAPRTVARPLRWRLADSTALVIGLLAVVGAAATRLA